MRAYYFDNIPGDQRLPHDYVPSRPVSDETLQSLGLKHWHIPIQGHEPKVDEVARTQGYKNRDIINVSKAGLGEVRSSHLSTTPYPFVVFLAQAYEAKIKTFFEECVRQKWCFQLFASG
jgi:1,2-dihydroxy-3-keto-5-methylthiopentene dioxygenase